MEDSGQTIRDEGDPVPARPEPKAWLCDADDQPKTEYVGDDVGDFRIRVGRQWYERFRQNAAGDSFYRVMR